MPVQTLKITSCTGGRAPSRFFPRAGEFTASMGIDPDLAIGSERHACGIAAPSAYLKFSGANVNSYVIAEITCPKTTKVYVVLANGKLISYTSSFGTETLLAQVAGLKAGGACYYNNYIYIFGTGNQLAYDAQTGNFTVGSVLTGAVSHATATIMADSDSGTAGTLTLGNITGTFQDDELITDLAIGSAQSNGLVTGHGDVSRFGPLDQGSPYLTGAWWGALGLTNLTDTTYPLIRTLELPNHWAFVHGDNSLYFLDYVAGQGLVHMIHTKKVTYEGDTNDTTVPSAYDVLALPFGYYPTSICGFDVNVAVSAIQTTAATLTQGNASLFIWNPTNEITFDQQINLPDSLATALVSRAGTLTVFSGAVQGGVRISEYVGGSTVSEIAYLEDGAPPFPGAVDVQGKRVYFGTYCLFPFESACVNAMGSRTSTKANDIQNVVTCGNLTAANDQITTALKLVAQQSGVEANVEPLVAVSSGTTKEIYKKVTGGANTVQSVFETPIVTIGRKFKLEKIRVLVGSAVITGTVIQLTVIYDDGKSSESPGYLSQALTPDASKAVWKGPVFTLFGQNNFRLQFSWIGSSVATPIAFPIEIDVSTFDDETAYE